MQSNTHIILNVQAPNVAVVVNAKQGDKLSRVITADLVDGDIPFVPPSGVAAAVRYFKPDNTIGFYDVTEDGAAAVVLDGSTATVTLAEQALTVPGNVYAEINFYTSTEKLTTFNFIIHVQKSAVSDQMIESTDYFSVLTERINALLGATTNPPYINETTKNWMIYSESTGEYEDSGFSSIGLIPPSLVTYQAGTSGTTPPTGTWMTSIPEVPQGDYLWTRTQFEFSDGTQQVSYSVARQGVDGTGSVRTVNENSPDATGNVYVMTVNPNLMDNWYFVNPVNQRVFSTADGTQNYTIDRWKMAIDATGTGKTITINSGYLTLMCSNTGEGAYVDMAQYIEPKLTARLIGKNITISVLTDKGLFSKTMNLDAGVYGNVGIDDNGICYIVFPATGKGTVLLRAYYGEAINVIAVKLELGDKQTLAHQDSSGNWVLNEIPDYGEQLARCQRYFVRFGIGSLPLGFGHQNGTGTTVDIGIPVPVPMAKTPVLAYEDIYIRVGTTQIKATSVSAVTNLGGCVIVRCTGDFSGHNYSPCSAISTAAVDLSADL